MNQTQLLAIAAIGVAFWYFTKKSPGSAVQAATKPAVAPAAGSDGIWGGFGVGGDMATAMGQLPAVNAPITASTKPLTVAPAPAASGAVFGGGSNASGSGVGGGLNAKGEWVYPDGSVYRGPSVSAEQAMSVLGY